MTTRCLLAPPSLPIATNSNHPPSTIPNTNIAKTNTENKNKDTKSVTVSKAGSTCFSGNNSLGTCVVHKRGYASPGLPRHTTSPSSSLLDFGGAVDRSCCSFLLE
ncbi:hypothetical protein B0O80DRAFT_101672 [Mortierella sp. GBAus27b]|nr:hypothetical protein B0O80DRAFT_101672 [Mortierella sp. GBAus27b]